MLRHYAGNPFVQQVIEDWHSLYKLARKEVRVKQGLSRIDVWETLERESPLHLEGYKDNEYLVVRLMYNKVDKKKYYDVRIFELYGGKMRKTNKGVYLPIDIWEKVKQCLNQITRRI